MKTVMGIGINDADYVVQKKRYLYTVNGKQKYKLEWCCPYYRKWFDMMRRCYSKSFHKSNPTYANCSVCSHWLYFSNFREWCISQETADNISIEDYSLDKDLLSENNTIYSPDYCVFVSQRVNTFILESSSIRGKYPLGVIKDGNKFTARCSNPYNRKDCYLGRYDTAEEAHLAWAKAKYEYAIILCEKECCDIVATAILKRYKNKLDDAKTRFNTIYKTNPDCQ